MASQDLIERLEKTILNIPDFPIEGIQFKDITPIFLNPKLYEDVIADLAKFSKGKVDVVSGIESRGFWYCHRRCIRSSVCTHQKKRKTPSTIYFGRI